MLTTKKVIEEAIHERRDEISKIWLKHNHLEFIEPQVKNLESQIAELKQSLQIIYDANNNK